MRDATLLAWMSGAMEPGSAAEVAAQVRVSPVLQARAVALRPVMSAPAAVGGWRIPPPGVLGGRRPVAMQALRMTMDAGPVPPLGGFSIRIAPVEDAEARWVVVLWMVDGVWRVAFPTDAGERIRLSDLPAEADGSRLLELVAGERVGEQRWAVALPTADAAWGGEDPWAGLQADIAAGAVAVTSVAVTVE